MDEIRIGLGMQQVGEKNKAGVRSLGPMKDLKAEAETTGKLKTQTSTQRKGIQTALVP